jgi:hypothetical protein
MNSLSVQTGDARCRENPLQEVLSVTVSTQLMTEAPFAPIDQQLMTEEPPTHLTIK